MIKNIVNLESLMLARAELDRIGLEKVSIEPGEINSMGELTSFQYDRLLVALQQAGIQVFENRKDVLVQQIKNIVMEIVYGSEEPPVYNMSVQLAQRLGHDYTYMSNLFSEKQHITIEKFYICHKIERVKELLIYEGLTLTEIAFRMRYSSLAHLSSQFKKVTGVTPSQFKHRHEEDDLPPEEC